MCVLSVAMKIVKGRSSFIKSGIASFMIERWLASNVIAIVFVGKEALRWIAVVMCSNGSTL